MARYRVELEAFVTVEADNPEKALEEANEWVSSIKASSFDSQGHLRSLATALKPETLELFDEPGGNDNEWPRVTAR